MDPELGPSAEPTAQAEATSEPPSSAAESAAYTPLELADPFAPGMTVEGVTRLCDEHLAIAEQRLGRIKALDPAEPAALDFERTVGALDDVFLSIGNGSELPYLLGLVHPDEAVRLAARACETKADKLSTAIWLDAELARIITAYAQKGEELSGERARLLRDTVRDFRRNGSELPPGKQQRLRELNTSITELGQRFVAEIARSVGHIRIKPEQLAGLSPSYVSSHPPDERGWVTISTDYPDYFPFVTYAKDRRAARELYIKFTNRGGDANLGLLDRLLRDRHEKARLLGYESWADYAIEVRMAGRAQRALDFLERVREAIRQAADQEYQQFMAEHVRLGGQGHGELLPPDRYYLEDRVRSRSCQLDSQKLAEYFDVEAVIQGLLDITAQMYGLEYRRVSAPGWHDEVLVYDIRSDARTTGRFYLDLYPRAHKYKHAAMFTIRTAKRLSPEVVQTPMAALVANLPRPGEPMAHDQVVTLFHEFGHVLHHLLTEAEFASYAGTNTVRDFVEVPSQTFEEWAWSREVLNRFARHRDTGEPIPASLFEAMIASRRVGLALHTQRQIFLALLDLGYHMREPGFDTTKVLEQIQKDTWRFAYVPGTHFQSSFGHLIGYDAGYYGYQWALSLARDAFSRFEREGLLNPETARAWRKQVLAPGGGADERAMLRAFLGRDPDEQAYIRFLRGS